MIAGEWAQAAKRLASAIGDKLGPLFKEMHHEPPTVTRENLKKVEEQVDAEGLRQAGMSDRATCESGRGQSWVRDLATLSRTDAGTVDTRALRKFLEEAPRLQVDEPRDLHAELSRFASETTRTDGVTLRKLGEGDGEGMSEASVHLIRDSVGQPVAIAKMFPNAEDLLREVSAIDRFASPEFQRFEVPTIHGLAALKWEGQDAGVLVMSMAPGRSVFDLMREAGAATDPEIREGLVSNLAESMQRVGGALGELHSKPAGSGLPVSPQWLESEISTMKHYAGELTHTPSCRDSLEAVGVDPDELSRRIDRVTENLRSDPGGAGLVHGDPHPENIFCSSDGRITLIDFEGAHRGMDASGKPRGAPGLDVMKSMMETFRSKAHLVGLRDAEIDRLVTSGYTAYRQAGGPEITAAAQAGYSTALRTRSAWWVAQARFETTNEAEKAQLSEMLIDEVTALRDRAGWT